MFTQLTNCSKRAINAVTQRELLKGKWKKGLFFSFTTYQRSRWWGGEQLRRVLHPEADISLTTAHSVNCTLRAARSQGGLAVVEALTPSDLACLLCRYHLTARKKISKTSWKEKSLSKRERLLYSEITFRKQAKFLHLTMSSRAVTISSWSRSSQRVLYKAFCLSSGSFTKGWNWVFNCDRSFPRKQ